jgi:hypothetical protein
VAAVPVFAQRSEFGVLIGASRRFIESGDAEPIPGTDDTRAFLDNEFSLSNSAVDLYWAMELEEATRLKFKVGRMEGPVAFRIDNPAFNPDAPVDGVPRFFRRDVEGEVQHASAVVEYRFDEPYGSTAIFGGLGFYRHSADDSELDSESDYGFQFGLNGDFPISRKYGAIVEATYHMTRGHFSPRYFTLTGGLRIAF